MDNERFAKIVDESRSMLTALILGTEINIPMPGSPIFYNAYFSGTECVVLGYQYEDATGSVTKPVAIMVDPEVFERLRVDHESGRLDGEGNQRPPQVI